MKKNGFTIIEMVTVLAILAIATVIFIPKINNAIKTSRADNLESVRESVIDSVNVYLNVSCGKSDMSLLKEEGELKIYLNKISDCGLIDSSIYNPMDGEYFNVDDEYVIVSIDELGLFDYSLSF